MKNDQLIGPSPVGKESQSDPLETGQETEPDADLYSQVDLHDDETLTPEEQLSAMRGKKRSNQQQSQDLSRLSHLKINWDLKFVLQSIMRLDDALTSSPTPSAPLSPTEVAHLMLLRDHITTGIKYGLRKCICGTVYCRSPEKDKPCVIHPAQIRENPDVVLACKWRSQRRL